MANRKSDPRIYIVVFLFLSCIISGGVLLALYLILPSSEPLYLMVGMVLVGIPWVFWFLTYIYRWTIKPCTAEAMQEANHTNNQKDARTNNNAPSPPGGSPRSPRDDPVVTPRDNGERHVKFGEVTVMGNDEERSTNNLIQHLSDGEDQDEDIESGSREERR